MTMEVLRRLKASLFYHRRQSCGHGQCLRYDISGTVLIAGDRLEPTREVPDVSDIDGWTQVDLPRQLCFWCPNQVRVKHRNPPFSEEIDLTPFRLIVDTLHALNLGVLRFCQELNWAMMWCNVWCDRRGMQQPEWMELACQVLRSELKAWEDKHVAANPEHKHTHVQRLTPAHFGTVSSRHLKLKAADTNTFFFFLVAKVRTVSAQLHNGDLWLGANNAMDTLLR